MTEHKTCKECRWNNYPECNGTIFDNIKMRIDNLRPGFECGQKDNTEIGNIITVHKSLKEEISDLKSRILSLEKK